MTDSNTPDPTPRFGEFASPEEQRSRIQQPEFETLPPAPGTVPPAPAEPRHPAFDRTVAAPAGRRIDSIATIGLLLYGMFTVVTSMPRLLDPVAYSETLFAVLGLEGGLSDPAGALPWAIGAVLALVFGWLVTAAVSLRRLRAGRVAFWVPILGGVVFNVVAALLMTVPIMGDPQVLSAMQSAGLAN